MRDMTVGHQPVVITQPGHTTTVGRAPVDRDVLANGVAVADFEP